MTPGRRIKFRREAWILEHEHEHARRAVATR
jgi:hypothetical protein